MDNQFSNQTDLYNVGRSKKQYWKDKLYAQSTEKLMTWTVKTEGWTLSVQKVKMHICSRVTTLSHCSITQPRLPNLICAQVGNGGTYYILVKDFTNGTTEGQSLVSKNNYLTYPVFHITKGSVSTLWSVSIFQNIITLMILDPFLQNSYPTNSSLCSLYEPVS